MDRRALLFASGALILPKGPRIVEPQGIAVLAPDVYYLGVVIQPIDISIDKILLYFRVVTVDDKVYYRARGNAWVPSADDSSMYRLTARLSIPKPKAIFMYGLELYQASGNVHIVDISLANGDAKLITLPRGMDIIRT